MNDVREQVKRRSSGTSAEFDAIWIYMSERGLVETATTVEELIHEANDLIELLRGAAPGDHPEPLRREERSFQEEIAVELDDHTREREAVFTEVAAAMAATHPDVRRFREEVLGGRLLKPEEAGELLYGGGDHDRGSEMGALQSLAGQLAKHYRWREYEAAWFVLTGDVPPVRLLSATVSHASGIGHYPNTARITLTADPCVDARTVEKLYRSAQRQLLGGDNRKMADRTLEVARFVAQKIKKHGAETWQKRTDRWNRQFPHWRYTSRGGLRQAFEKFWHPNYGRPGWEPYDPTPAQQSRDEHLRRKAESDFQELASILAAKDNPGVRPLRQDGRGSDGSNRE